MNVFSIESFMDELALAAKADPVEFRLRHLDGPARPRRHRAGGARVSAGRAAEAAAGPRPRLCLCAVQEPRGLSARSRSEVEVEPRDRPVTCWSARRGRRRQRPDRQSGRRAQPDRRRRSCSRSAGRCTRALPFDDTSITSIDWADLSDPAFRRACRTASRCTSSTGRASPSSARAKPAQGPAAAAIANAIANATGKRLRESAADAQADQGSDRRVKCHILAHKAQLVGANRYATTLIEFRSCR